MVCIHVGMCSTGSHVPGSAVENLLQAVVENSRRKRNPLLSPIESKHSRRSRMHMHANACNCTYQQPVLGEFIKMMKDCTRNVDKQTSFRALKIHVHYSLSLCLTHTAKTRLPMPHTIRARNNTLAR